MPPTPPFTMPITFKDYVIFGLRVFIGFIFVLSGAFQFLDLQFLPPSALQLEIFPASWLQHGSVYFGIGEIIVGLWLVLGVWIKTISTLIGGILLLSLGSNLPVLFGSLESGYHPPSIFMLTDISLLPILLLLIVSQRHRLTIIEVFQPGE